MVTTEMWRLTAGFLSVAFLCGLLGYVAGYVHCENHWKAKKLWVEGQRTIEQQMHEAGWHRP